MPVSGQPRIGPHHSVPAIDAKPKAVAFRHCRYRELLAIIITGAGEMDDSAGFPGLRAPVAVAINLQPPEVFDSNMGAGGHDLTAIVALGDGHRVGACLVAVHVNGEIALLGSRFSRTRRRDRDRGQTDEQSPQEQRPKRRSRSPEPGHTSPPLATFPCFSHLNLGRNYNGGPGRCQGEMCAVRPPDSPVHESRMTHSPGNFRTMKAGSRPLPAEAVTTTCGYGSSGATSRYDAQEMPGSATGPEPRTAQSRRL